MSDYAPTIDQLGISAPNFASVQAVLQARFREIYGDDIYIDPDSQDGQLIGIFSLALSDLNAACVALYNAFSPATAQGNGLSSVVKINGLRRLDASYSTVDVVLVGVVGTVINNGKVGDGNHQWALPAQVIIPAAGQVVATATCTVLGAIQALPNTVTSIMTPVRGWQSVTNPGAAAEGRPIETDGELRLRQTRSVAKPSQSLFESLYANVWQVRNVTRLAAYENPTHKYDGNGLPPHSICLVVEGGDATDIGMAMLMYKNPGCNSVPDGVTSPPLPSPQDVHLVIKDLTGDHRKINFYRPKYVRIAVQVDIEPGQGWSGEIESQIKNAVAAYINALPIGSDVRYFRVSVPINMCNKQFIDAYNVVGIRISGGSGSLGNSDIQIGFREAAQCAISDVVINVVAP